MAKFFPKLVEERLDGHDELLNNHSALLADITQFKLLADIQETDYKIGNSVDYNFIRNKQTSLYGVYYQKLTKSIPLKICCIGDSLTYGQDTTSADKRTADITVMPDGTTHSFTRASITYPEALQEYLQGIFGSSNISVLNRGCSGDWVKRGYERWCTKHDSDLTIIMYGTNDSRASWVPDDLRGNLSSYISWYEQMIIRETLWGKAVIILAPPKLQTAKDYDIQSFSNALYELGDKYGVPVIDASDFTANYPYSIYSDAVHFNASGYRVVASKIAAVIIAGAKKYYAKDNVHLLTRPEIDGARYFGGATFTDTTGSVVTPAEISSGKGIIGTWTGTSKGIIYSFYSEENDLMILPFYYATTGSLRLTLDFNTISPQNSNDLLVDSVISQTETIPKQIDYTSSFSLNPKLTDWIKSINDSTQPTVLRVSEKGWHTVKVETTDVNCTVIFNALYLMSYRNFRQQREIQSKTSAYGFSTHAVYTDTTNVTSSQINVNDLASALGLTLDTTLWWKATPVKLKIVIMGDTKIDYIIEHIITLGSTSFNYGWGISSANQTQISSTANSAYIKTCSSVSYDTSTKTLTLNWAGKTDRATQCWITL